MEESARAAEKVCIAEAVDIFSGFGVAEHTVTMVLGFRAKGELSLGFNMDFEKFVGIVRDILIYFSPSLSFGLCFVFLRIVMKSREEEGDEDLKGRVWRTGF